MPKQSKKQHIFEDLSRRIKAEEWTCGGMLPPMTELCRSYHVSLITLVGAMKLLKEAGLVEQRRGSGTFVRWSRDQIFFPQLRPEGRSVEVTHSLLNASPLHLFIMQQLAESFMRVYTDVRIRFRNLPASRDREDPYIQRITACDMPCCGEFYWHAIYAKLDALVPLEEMPGYDVLKASLMEQCAYPTANSGGHRHIHGLTLYLDLPSFGILNRRWSSLLGVNLPRQEITMASLLRMLRHGAVKKANSIFPLALPLPREWHSVKPYVEILSQGIAPQEYAPDEASSIRRILDSDRAEQILEELGELLRAAGPRLCLGKENEYFALGKVGVMPFAGSWTLQLIETLNGDLPYRTFAMPPFCTAKHYRPFYSGFSVGIFRDGISGSRQKKAAWDWLKFLFCRQAQEVCSQSMHIPVQKEASPYVSQTNPETWKVIQTALRPSLPQPDFVGMRRVYSRIGNVMRQFLSQKTGAKECLALLKNSLDP